MIIAARRITPFVHFGFDRATFLKKQVGVPVRIYIDGLISKEIFTISILTTGTVTMVTNRIYDIEFSAAGLEPIQVQFTNTQTGEVFVSNIAETEQIKFTFDNDVLTWDSTVVTFDNQQI